MTVKTHPQLTSIAIQCPEESLLLPLDQITAPLNAGVPPQQLILQLNRQGLLAWPDNNESPDEFRFWVRCEQDVLVTCQYTDVPLH
ncbi:hypothetical protein TUM12370_27640 [Salmonella enterica subsp. enterica serovar Choleraesuis]|nr:hypothetical protein TUM12370_27640 [Salmonella enterica subsp. enterica serovar Choleraesuis]